MAPIGNTTCTIDDWKQAHGNFDQQRKIGDRLRHIASLDPRFARREHAESCGKMDTIENLEAVDGPLPELTDDERKDKQLRYIAKTIHGNVDGVSVAQNCPNCKMLWA